VRPERPSTPRAAGAPVSPGTGASSGSVFRARIWIAALLPLALLAALIAIIVKTHPADGLRGADVPPIERLVIDRAVLGPDGIALSVLNDGPDPVTIAQVTVDDAYWTFSADRGTTLDHLARTRISVPYPWVNGEAHRVKILTSTGAVFEHEIAVAVSTPELSAAALQTFTLIGLYVGVIPVALGLLWRPLTSRIGSTGLDALLALTVGLLAFLLVDAVHEGLEAAAGLPSSYQGTVIFTAAAAGAYLGLESIGRRLRARRAESAGSPGAVLAMLVAVGIGLHNLGEGLAIGAAITLGEAALGSLLIVGFTLHNTTEGLAIVAPLARERASTATLVRLGLIGGVPTIAGAWLGGLFYSPLLAVLFLGLGAGAIAQVALQISAQIAGGRALGEAFASGPILAGLLAGVAAMYVTGLLVG
jgi:zinc transporter, ZIP family